MMVRQAFAIATALLSPTRQRTFPRLLYVCAKGRLRDCPYPSKYASEISGRAVVIVGVYSQDFSPKRLQQDLRATKCFARR